MYKWHVNSAIGRSRPLANDLTRVADGIAASLRQFSVSAQRYTNEDKQSSPPRTQTRSHRSATAAKDISSLSPTVPPPSKGIDARSLAAKPPGQSFTIRYTDPGDRATPNRQGVASRGSAPRPASFRGGPARGGRGGAATRGGTGGRGGSSSRGGGLRGRNARGPRQKKQKHAEEIDFEVPPFSAEEEREYNLITGGLEADYNPITSLESLRGWGPSVITSGQGLKEAVTGRLGAALDRRGPVWQDRSWHKSKILESGLTVFKDAEEKSLIKTELGNGLGKRAISVDEATKKQCNDEWIAGHYEKPGTVDSKNVIGLVGAYARKNQGYLAEDTRQFVQEVSALLPASLQQKAPAKGERRA